MGKPIGPSHDLPRWTSVLAVVAHPDDESFGLGAVIDLLGRRGAAVHVLVLTRGEVSTLVAAGGEDLAAVRTREAESAGRHLGVAGLTMLDLPDGGLGKLPVDELADHVRRAIEAHAPDGLLVFDPSGITGHPDHVAATRAAVEAAAPLRLPVLAWTVPADVAEEINRAFDATMTGRSRDEVDHVLAVDRARQLEAARAHVSQAVPGSLLWRRLELQGRREYLVRLD